MTRKNTFDKIFWGFFSFCFWLIQFGESFTTKTYKCVSHVVDHDEAIYELEYMKKKAPVIDMKISNFHYESTEKYREG